MVAKNPKGLNVNNPRCNRGQCAGTLATNPKGLNVIITKMTLKFKPFGFFVNCPIRAPRIHRGLFIFKPFGFFANCPIRAPRLHRGLFIFKPFGFFAIFIACIYTRRKGLFNRLGDDLYGSLGSDSTPPQYLEDKKSD